MNTRAEAGIAQATKPLPLASIAPSNTITQARRRARFHKDEAWEQFVDSVRQVGVMQPVLVRDHARTDSVVHYELIAGERRWRAAQEAGLGEILAVITNITDEELVQFQIIENKHRQSLHVLDEAEGVREMMEVLGLTAEQAGERIGLKKAHVYNRLKLLKLAPAVMAALESGAIHQSAAVRIAKVPGPKLQQKALKIATTKDHRGEVPSDRQLGVLLRDSFMVRLDGVPFDLADATLSEARGACHGCEHFSGNDAELQAELTAEHGPDARLCTDKPCHDQKVQLHFYRRIDSARQAGRHIIEGEAAKEVMPDQHSAQLEGYVDLDSECVEIETPDNAPEDWVAPTYRQLIGDAAAKGAAVLVAPSSERPIEVLPEKDLAKLLKKKGITFEISTDQLPSPSGETPEEEASRLAKEAEVRRKQQEREQLEHAYRLKLLQQIHAKWKGPLKRTELEEIATRMLDHDEYAAAVMDHLYTGAINVAKLKDDDLNKLIFTLVASNAVEYAGGNPGLLIATAKRLKIDPVKVRKQAKAESDAEGKQ